MNKLNLKNCTFNDAIALDEEGNLDDNANGKYGFRAFYTVPKKELIASQAFHDLPNNYNNGELEFSVDRSGKQFGETLLWMTTIDNDNMLSNEDFVEYEFDITELVENFNAIVKPWDDIEI